MFVTGRHLSRFVPLSVRYGRKPLLATRVSFTSASAGGDDEEGGNGGYMSKFRGNPGKHSPAATPKEILIAGVGTLVGVGALSSVHFGLSPGDATTVLGSFGATSVLIFGYPAAPFSQPRNVIGGHMLSAFCGVCASQYLTGLLPFPWAAGPIAVSVATMAMMATRTVHPPAGGTCLLAVLGAAKFQAMGFFYLIPAGLGATSLVLIGAVFNNVYKERSYPDYWW